jgi:hypothetical protein
MLSDTACDHLAVQIKEGLLEMLVTHRELREGQCNSARTLNGALDEARPILTATMDRYFKDVRVSLGRLSKSTTRQANHLL